MFIEVLYSDLTRNRVPIDEADQLVKTGVLAVIISCPDADNPRIFIDDVGYRRIAEGIGSDFYYLLNYKDDGLWYAIECRDYGDHIHFHKNSLAPFDDPSLREEHPRYNYWTLTFEGLHVDDETWADALEIYEEMH